MRRNSGGAAFFATRVPTFDSLRANAAVRDIGTDLDLSLCPKPATCGLIARDVFKDNARQKTEPGSSVDECHCK